MDKSRDVPDHIFSDVLLHTVLFRRLENVIIDSFHKDVVQFRIQFILCVLPVGKKFLKFPVIALSKYLEVLAALKDQAEGSGPAYCWPKDSLLQSFAPSP